MFFSVLRKHAFILFYHIAPGDPFVVSTKILNGPKPLLSPHLLYVCPEDRFFCTHFLERAIAARRAGYTVSVLAPDTGSSGPISAGGLRFIPLPLKRHGTNIFSELRGTWKLAALYKKMRPIIVHHIGLKLIIRGTLAARLAGIDNVVNAPVGMGFVFSSDSLKMRLLRPLLLLGLRGLLAPKDASVIFENPEDQEMCHRLKAANPTQTSVIRGAGVNTNDFRVRAEPPGTPVVLMAARLLWAKGVGVFADAARVLKNEGVNVRFVLAGGTDLANSASVPETQLMEWQREGLLEWIGFQRDIRPALAAATIFCLPSYYREGLPKVVLEAMATGVPVITTDTIGCREAVRNEDNGLLIEPKDPQALAAAVSRLLHDRDLRQRLGARGRDRAEKEFATNIVVPQTIQLYKRLAPPAATSS